MDEKPNAAETVKKPRGRWFQFRLRTMLIGVALLAIPCGYVGQQAGIVSRRAAERKWLEQNGARFMDDYALGPRASENLPWLRRLLGDRSAIVVSCKDQAQVERVKKVFEESEIVGPSLNNDADY